MKKILLSTILIITVLISFVKADVVTIKDIDKSAEYAKASITSLAQMQIIKGDENGNYNPKGTITRAEMVALMVRVLNIDTTMTPQNITFDDVPKAHWANKYVEAAYRAGIINGVEAKKFGVNDICTREQIAVMFVRALKILNDYDVVEYNNLNNLTDKSQIADWAKREVETAIEAGIMTGTTPQTFGAKELANKEQAAVVIDRFVANKDEITQRFENKKDVLFPDLYRAMEKNYYNGYMGELEASININERSEGTSEFMNIQYDILSRVNKSNAVVDMDINIRGNGVEVQTLQFEEIVTDEKYYIKDPTDGMWVVIDGIYGAGAVGGFVYNPLDLESEETGTVINNGFYKFYNKLPITQEGTVEINGQTATKYVASLDSSSIGYLFSDYDFNEVKDYIDTTFGTHINYVYEFYVANGQILRQTFTFGGQTSDKDGEYPVDIAVNMVVDYKNIGKEFIITAPKPSTTKPFEY